jgi:hypothetical protein
MFPPFVGNELDPLLPFSDAAFHADCVNAHPLAAPLYRRLNEIRANRPKGYPTCCICGLLITDPDHVVSLGYLTSDQAHPLYGFNFKWMHDSCIPDWPEREGLHEQLCLLRERGLWKGRAIDSLIDDFKDSERTVR